MNTVMQCPSVSLLLRLVHGDAFAEKEDLIEHLLHCRDCAASLEHFHLSESLLLDLKARAATEDKTLLPELVHQLSRQLDDLRMTPALGGSHHATASDHGDSADQGWARLLQPALEAGELGWLGPYRILKVLGAGGMGRVFLAEDTHLQRRVALKVMSPSLLDMPSARERFLREARAAAAIRDEHIVTIYQVGQADDVPYLAMELLYGENLDDCVKREGMLSPALAVRIGREIAEGLAVAHGQGLVHRDIKPANIWLEHGESPGARASASPPTVASSARAETYATEPQVDRREFAAQAGFKRVKLLDFGLARAAEGPASITATGQVIGTPHYMSPEQARGDHLDQRSDLFSLGCVLYRMIAGREPFEGPNVMAVLTALAVEQPAPLEHFHANLPEDLAALILRLLSKDPRERPQSAHEVVAALRTLEDELPGSSASISMTTGVPRGARSTVASRLGDRTALPRGGAVALAGATLSGPLPVWRRPPVLAGIASGILGLLALVVFLSGGEGPNPNDDEPKPAPTPMPVFTGPPIKVGILHSLSGTMADSEASVVDATRLAIEEINAQGGINGRKIECLLRDGQSEADVFALEAERLIKDDKVQAIFGCWTSAARKKVKPIVEKHDHLLLYPVQYEGLEQSPNIIYLGGTPSQQILPAVRYAFANLGKRRFFLIGSDYVFPRAANEIIKDELKSLGALVVGETYVSLGETGMHKVVDAIVAAKPDVILNTINGDSNRSFFRTLRAAGVTPETTPTISFSISEPELRTLGSKHMAGDYAAWNYFMSLPDQANKRFVEKFRKRYGAEHVTSDPMLAAYAAVHLWAEAVGKAGDATPAKVRPILREEDFEGPGGTIKIDPATQHTRKPFRLGKIVEGARFEVVWSSEVLIAPEPYLPTRTREQWDRFLNDLYTGWGGRWENPGR